MKPEEDKNQGRNNNRISPIIITMNNCSCSSISGEVGFIIHGNKRRRNRISIFLDSNRIRSDYFSFQGYCCVSVDNKRNRVYIETKEYLDESK